jgi:hypothetical protein
MIQEDECLTGFLKSFMHEGPFLIFDKSTLQSLNPDEAMWLDNFFVSNITPLFFIETLADLEKQIRAGRTPEDVVGNIAYKTPDLQSRANTHHDTLLQDELRGVWKASIGRGIPVISGGMPVAAAGGNKGLIFKHGPEDEALLRWQRHEFLDIERQIAKFWRRQLSGVSYEDAYSSFGRWFTKTGKPKSLAELKSNCDAMIEKSEQRHMLQYGLILLGFPEHFQQAVLKRWEDTGKQPVRDFAPYFRHVFSVELFFYLSIASDLVSKERASNKVDFAYLYYLPFCMVFTSNDHLHAKVAPLFMRPNQTFVDGAALKADLGKLDAYYSSLPEDETKQYVFEIAPYPPTDDSYLTTRLWDKHLPEWRKQQAEPPIQLSKAAQDALLKLAKRFQNEGTPLDPATPIALEDVQVLSIEKKVLAKKGKWTRLPPEESSKSEP